MRQSKLLTLLGLLAVPVILPAMLPATVQAQVTLSITLAPPELPVYEQPPVPAPDYLWAPGYWAYGPYGYYWVPGTWVQPPRPGLLWTPGYWGWSNGLYVFHTGYWAPHIGFYGGVNYGFGYTGRGYEGGYWDGGHFRYNTAVNHIDNSVHITNVYNKTVNNVTVTHVSYNGGQGGIHLQPTVEERAVVHERVAGPTPQQRQHRQQAGADPQFRAEANHGQPPVMATQHPGQFHEAPRPAAPQHAEQPRSAEPPMDIQHAAPPHGPKGPLPPHAPEHPQAPRSETHAEPHGEERHDAPHEEGHGPDNGAGGQDRHGE